jgi:hypothetical protein
MVELAPIMSKLMTAKGPYDVILRQEEKVIMSNIEFQLEHLMEEISQEATDEQQTRRSKRDLCNSQFHEAMKLAESSPASAEAIRQLAKVITEQMTKELMSRTASSYISQNEVRKAVKDVTYEEMKNIARPGIKQRFTKGRISELINTKVKEMENFVNNIETQGGK